MAIGTTSPRARGAARWAAGAVVAMVALTGCNGSTSSGRGDISETSSVAESSPVIASSTYAAAVGNDAQERRVADVAAVVRRLRTDTTGGWQAQQDDTTGWAAELAGGRFAASGEPTAVARTFLERYGAAFGLTGADGVEFPSSVSYDAADVAVVRLPQVVGDVPVDGGSLLVPVAKASGGEAGQISFARGRIYSVDGVATTPRLTAQAARAAVQKLTGSVPSASTSLTIFTGAAQPRLAWTTSVTVKGGPAATGSGAASLLRSDAGGLLTGPQIVFVDALTGSLLGARPSATSPGLVRSANPTALGKYDFELPPAGRPVVVPATLSDGRKVQVHAEQLPDGSIVLVDATEPGADRASKRGIIAVFDGRQGNEDQDRLGPVMRFPNANISDMDALQTMWSLRQVYDFYRTQMGRQSFDGQNSPLVGSVHVVENGESCFDNAYFATAPGQSRMAVGVPCVENGKPTARTFADLSVIGHEVTHGVTHTNAQEFAGPGFVQQGAIDEGTSDYFGDIIENSVLGEVHTTGSHFMCHDLISDNFCHPKSNGQKGLRDINSGATMADYAATLGDPFGLANLAGDDGHDNSIIWTNALWKARQRIANLDGGNMLTSKKAHAFDLAVHRGTTLYLTSSSDLIDAAAAVERAAKEVKGLGAKERRLIHQQFVDSRFCRTCNLPRTIARYVATSAKLKSRPLPTDSGVVFNQFDSRLQSRSVVGVAGQSQQQVLDGGSGFIAAMGARGHYVAQTYIKLAGNGESDQVILRDLSTKAGTVLSSAADPFVAPAVSATNVVWADAASNSSSVLRIRPLAGGSTRSLALPGAAAHLATDGDRIAVYMEDGALLVGSASTGRFSQLAKLGTARRARVLVAGGGISMSGSRLAVLEKPLKMKGRLLVFDLDKRIVTTVSQNATPFGVSISGDLVVWAENIGPMSGRVVEQGGYAYADTELRGYSFKTGTFYRMVDAPGQQGFPAYDGKTLVWQDSIADGNDIFQMPVPNGL